MVELNVTQIIQHLNYTSTLVFSKNNMLEYYTTY